MTASKRHLTPDSLEGPVPQVVEDSSIFPTAKFPGAKGTLVLPAGLALVAMIVFSPSAALFAQMRPSAAPASIIAPTPLPADAIAKHLGLSSGNKVLLLGIADGSLMTPIAKAVGAQGAVLAADTSQPSVTLAKEKLTPEVATQVRAVLLGPDWESQIGDSGEFDLIVLCEMLDRLPKQQEHLRLLKRKLRQPDGGLFVLRRDFLPEFAETMDFDHEAVVKTLRYLGPKSPFVSRLPQDLQASVTGGAIPTDRLACRQALVSFFNRCLNDKALFAELRQLYYSEDRFGKENLIPDLGESRLLGALIYTYYRIFELGTAPETPQQKLAVRTVNHLLLSSIFKLPREAPMYRDEVVYSSDTVVPQHLHRAGFANPQAIELHPHFTAWKAGPQGAPATDPSKPSIPAPAGEAARTSSPNTPGQSSPAETLASPDQNLPAPAFRFARSAEGPGWTRTTDPGLVRRERLGHLPADQVIKALHLTEGMIVADVGAASGVFTFPMARAVGATGKVVATDVDPGTVQSLKERAKSEGLQNVEAQQVQAGGFDDFYLSRKFDRIFLSSVMHYLANPESYFRSLRAAVKEKTGTVVIVQPHVLWKFQPEPHHRYDTIAAHLAEGGSAYRARKYLDPSVPAAFVWPLTRGTQSPNWQQWANLMQGINRIVEEPSFPREMLEYFDEKPFLGRTGLNQRMGDLALTFRWFFYAHGGLFDSGKQPTHEEQSTVVRMTNKALVDSLILGPPNWPGWAMPFNFFLPPQGIVEVMERAGYRLLRSEDLFTYFGFLEFAPALTDAPTKNKAGNP